MMRFWLVSFLGLTGVHVFGSETEVPFGSVEYEEGVLDWEPFVNQTVLNRADFNKYTDCDDVFQRGLYKKPGIYLVYLNAKEPLHVVCDFAGSVGRFVIMQQKYGKQNFRRPFRHYEQGFGSAQSGDFWYGLMRTKMLTDMGNNVLTVTMQDWNNIIKVIQYKYFSLGPKASRYRLSIAGYASSYVLPDDFSHNNNMPFSTIDMPDIHRCANQQGGGWWYNYCTFTLPTGHYYTGGPYHPSGKFWDGIYYKDWLGFGYSLKYIRLDLSAI